MSVTIELNGDNYLVNNKSLSRDMNGNWIAETELTPSEKHFFGEYMRMIKKTKAREIKATYKT